jgi:CRISPR-associated protein Csx3
MNTNLFPAILLAGPPNCGKSVLAFLLTHHLRQLGVAHYLLRSAPDGEGDWFLAGQPDVVQTLRAMHKRHYSSHFITHMHNAIMARPLPLLVDIGGRPQGDQINLIKACTHSILLYRSEEERLQWRTMLNEARLTPIAELRSTLNGDEIATERQPYLRGTISGLQRDPRMRKTGLVFGILLELVAGICSYDASSLEQIHLKHAPFPVVNERDLAGKLSVPVEGERTIWSPSHLAHISNLILTSKPISIYGRGPVWLASALAALTLPESFVIFDARYGWLSPPPLRLLESTNLLANTRVSADVNIKVLPFQDQDAWVEIGLPGGTIEPYEIGITSLPSRVQGGLVLSGKIPRWLFATLVHHLAPNHAWLAVDDPRLSQAIIVSSNSHSHQVGDTLPRLSTSQDTLKNRH